MYLHGVSFPSASSGARELVLAASPRVHFPQGWSFKQELRRSRFDEQQMKQRGQSCVSWWIKKGRLTTIGRESAGVEATNPRLG